MIPRQNAKRTSYLALLVVCALLTVLKTSGLASSAHVNLASVETTRLLQRSSRLSTLVECGGYRNLSSFSDLFYRALNLDSSNERALLGAGRIEWLRGNCQAAAALFDEAVIQRPNDVMATFFWANSLLAQGEIIRAMDFYKEIDSSGAFFAVGQEIAYTQGRDAALKWYELSVAIEPTRKNVEALSSTYLNVKLDSKRALEAWEQLKNSSSQYTVDYWYASAQIAEITGNDSQAVLHYESAILLSQDAY